MATSPDGKNVYAIGFSDEAIAEFTRNPDGSLKEIGCIADSSASGGTCSQNATATGLFDPRAIAVSPDGQNVYVAAGVDPNGDIAEFTRNADGSLTQPSGHDCIGENGTYGCADIGGHGLKFPNDLAISPDDKNVYVADQVGEAVTELARAADGSLSEPGGGADCIQDQTASNSDCSNTGTGLSDVTGVVVSPDGNNVYTGGAPNLSSRRLDRRVHPQRQRLPRPARFGPTTASGPPNTWRAAAAGRRESSASSDWRRVRTAATCTRPRSPRAVRSRSSPGARAER